ncbi:uridine kinase family protein [Marasmitruncus massiliensis]|uniref:uridine kinase family protein n=1 Tax=Marasmitruncus massiliensis TaxID=1944642 RepID=UPI000C7D5625|nr:hypothetical protein [Marasmitruncus massiliensis]
MTRNPELETASKEYLIEQTNMHPSMRPLDMIKLCYQAALGSEHLLRELAAAKRLFMEEFSAVTNGSSRLYEKISPDRCRVNLFAWKERGLPPEWLFRMFAGSASMPSGTDAEFRRLLKEAGLLCAAGAMPFSCHDWENELNTYWGAGGGAVHHSEQYRISEHPAYRLVCTRFIRLFPLLERMAKLDQNNDVCVIALDGRAASGKTTMADQLSLILGAGIVHMDDFFLPAPLRTAGRLEEPGGNVHYERFAQKVLPKVAQTKAFSYRRFDCSKLDFGDTQEVRASKWRIVEGAYSCHPFFGDYTDLRVFCDVEPEEQLHRIELRNGTEKAKVFAARWIPSEERYFSRYQIREKADVIL